MAQRFKNRAAQIALGERVRTARKQADLTIEELADRVGVHHATVSRTENGLFPTINPSVQKICTFLRIGAEPALEDPATLLRRLRRLSADDPDVVRALEGLVDALEARHSNRAATR